MGYAFYLQRTEFTWNLDRDPSTTETLPAWQRQHGPPQVCSLPSYPLVTSPSSTRHSSPKIPQFVNLDSPASAAPPPVLTTPPALPSSPAQLLDATLYSFPSPRLAPLPVHLLPIILRVKCSGRLTLPMLAPTDAIHASRKATSQHPRF